MQEYDVVSSDDDLEGLISAVNELLAQNWVVVGGLTVIAYTYGPMHDRETAHMYYQAVTRIRPPEFKLEIRGTASDFADLDVASG